MTYPSNMLPYDAQLAIEHTYSRKFINKYIREELELNEEIVSKVEQGVLLLEEWLQGEYYPSKQQRLSQLLELDLNQLVWDVFVNSTYHAEPSLLTSATAQLASSLGFNDKVSGITTTAEIFAILGNTDVYDIYRAKSNSLEIRSNIVLSARLRHSVERAAYLPPMICKPLRIEHNKQSGYLTHNESVILGSGNHHSDPVALDVLNLQNQVSLSLDFDFMRSTEETPTFELDTIEKTTQWNKFKTSSREFAALMVARGNEFYLTHRYDKRGRIYASGYHVSTMGTAYKKSCIEFTKEEYIDVPEEYQL